MNTILNFIHAAGNVLLHSIRTATFCWVTVALGSAVFLTACGQKTELDDLFGKEYEVAEIVYRTPIISAEELGEKVPWLRIREERITYVDVNDHEWECSAAEKLKLTEQNFDKCFNADAWLKRL